MTTVPKNIHKPDSNALLWDKRMARLNSGIASGVRGLPPLAKDRHWSEVVHIDTSRNALLTEKGLEIVKRYMSRKLGETDPQHLFARVAWAGADDEAHAQRLYDAMSLHQFMPATPVLTNLGTDRGLPISCFLQSVDDTMSSIIDSWEELSWMSAMGGGVGTYWGRVRPVGESVGDVGQTSGVIPFMKVQEAVCQAVSQGGIRRGSVAYYLPVSHPEIREFLAIREPVGDLARKALFANHGVVIDDEFMRCVHEGREYALRSPHTGQTVEMVSARQIMERIIEIRMHLGEPYLLFIDTVNESLSEAHRRLGLSVETSNLCSEIVLPTGQDHHGQWRSAVCCLSSLNLAKWDEYADNDEFFIDVFRFLDHVLDEFILRAPSSLDRAAYSAWRERSVGLGVMGFHTYLQNRGIAYGTLMAKSVNHRIFRRIRAMADKASHLLAEERGPCPDAADAGVQERFSYKLAIAPTASISTVAGGVSPGIDPISANAVVHKTQDGSHTVWNSSLIATLERLGMNRPEVLASIIAHGGSIQHLEEIPLDIRRVYRTAYEIDQMELIELMGDRAQYIDQAASNNLFIDPTTDKYTVLQYHLQAWARGVKSLYYCRSKSTTRPDNMIVTGQGPVEAANTMERGSIRVSAERDFDQECSGCA